MDFRYNKIYSIKDGEFILLYERERVSSSEEYYSLLNEVYNTQESVDLLEEYAVNNYEGDEFSTYEEIIEAINNY